MTQRLCRFPSCGRPHYAKGYCEAHFKQTLNERPPRVSFSEGPWIGQLKELMANAPGPTLPVERFHKTPNSREVNPAAGKRARPGHGEKVFR